MTDLLGKTVIDVVSGFKGTVTGVCIYHHGENQVQITAKSVNNAKPDDFWVSDDRIESRSNFSNNSLHVLETTV